MNSSECVFCTRKEQPKALFETPLLYIMPDKFPFAPGHILIVSKEHLSCYGAGNIELYLQLEETAGRIRKFLERMYAKPVLIYENGIAGQSVFHAHLHLIPVALEKNPYILDHDSEICSVNDWQEVSRFFKQHGTYRYGQIGNSRLVVPGRYQPALIKMREELAKVTGLIRNENGWVRTTSEKDINEVGRRWHEWIDS